MIFKSASILVCLLLSSMSAHAEELPGDMPLTSAFAEKLVSENLPEIAGSDGYKVSISRPSLPLGNQEARPTRIVIKGLRHDVASGRFSAVMIGTIGDEPRFELELEGRVQPLVSAPVLTHTLQQGDLITAADIGWEMVLADTLSAGSFTDERKLIGAEARRRLSPGRVLTNRDVGPPRLVLRGKPVRVVFAERGMTLTAIGTARDDGAFGDPIRVINPESRLEIQGVATGHQEVTVGNAVMPSAGS